MSGLGATKESEESKQQMEEENRENNREMTFSKAFKKEPQNEDKGKMRRMNRQSGAHNMLAESAKTLAGSSMSLRIGES